MIRSKLEYDIGLYTGITKPKREKQWDDVYSIKSGKVTKVVTGNSWCDYSQSSFERYFRGAV